MPRNSVSLTKSTYFRLVLDNNLLRDTFKKAARSKDAYPGFAKYRASDMCNTCMSIIKQKLVEMAIHTKTPFIVFAFSPGQTEVPFVTLTKPFMIWIRKLFDATIEDHGGGRKGPVPDGPGYYHRKSS